MGTLPAPAPSCNDKQTVDECRLADPDEATRNACDYFVQGKMSNLPALEAKLDALINGITSAVKGSSETQTVTRGTRTRW